MFNEYKDKLMEDVDLPLKVKGMRIDPSDDGASSIYSDGGDSSLFNDLKDAREGFTVDAKYAPPSSAVEMDAAPPVAELDGTIPIAEMDASQPLVELPADTKLAQSKVQPDWKKHAELPA
jgi:hypothetical protein